MQQLVMLTWCHMQVLMNVEQWCPTVVLCPVKWHHQLFVSGSPRLYAVWHSFSCSWRRHFRSLLDVSSRDQLLWSQLVCDFLHVCSVFVNRRSQQYFVQRKWFQIMKLCQDEVLKKYRMTTAWRPACCNYMSNAGCFMKSFSRFSAYKTLEVSNATLWARPWIMLGWFDISPGSFDGRVGQIRVAFSCIT